MKYDVQKREEEGMPYAYCSSCVGSSMCAGLMKRYVIPSQECVIEVHERKNDEEKKWEHIRI